MCLLLTLAMPFFVTLPFCVASVVVRSCFRFYSLSLLRPENVRVFYLFCLAFLSSSRHFYRFLSFYLDLCTNFFSLFVPFSVFFERCGGKLSVNRFYFHKIDISAAMQNYNGLYHFIHTSICKLDKIRTCSRSAKQTCRSLKA